MNPNIELMLNSQDREIFRLAWYKIIQDHKNDWGIIKEYIIKSDVGRLNQYIHENLYGIDGNQINYISEKAKLDIINLANLIDTNQYEIIDKIEFYKKFLCYDMIYEFIYYLLDRKNIISLKLYLDLSDILSIFLDPNEKSTDLLILLKIPTEESEYHSVIELLAKIKPLYPEVKICHTILNGHKAEYAYYLNLNNINIELPNFS